ncbi:MAG: sodium/proline symporter PutP [Gammaproteobacteria bacterium]|nr:sodium/proline symporter PutP [Gammaproteobacteria bacterium]
MLALEFTAYLCLMLGIGYWSLRHTHSNDDFLIGGRRLGPVTSAISAGASDMSSWLLLGLPGAVFAGGLVEGFWISTGLLIGAWLNWRLVAGRLRALSESLSAITLPTYLARRFDDSNGALRIATTAVILVFFTLYVAAGLKGGTLLFAHAFNAQPSVALLVTVTVVVSYTFLGGYLAVCWTDLVQGLLMLSALTFCALLATTAIADAPLSLAQVRPGVWHIATSWLSGASLLAWGLGYFGQPHILARFFGIRSIADIPRARRIGIGWMALCLLLAVSIGLLGIGYHALYPLTGVSGDGGNSERIFLALTGAMFHPLLAGLVYAAVLAAVMSTADSQLLVLSSALTEDLPWFRHWPDRHRQWLSRAGIVGFAVIATLIAANDSGTILDLVGYAWGGFGAALGPVVLLSVTWRGTTRNGALAGLVVGAVTVYLCKNHVTIPGHYLYELLPGFFCALLAVVIVSKMTRLPGAETLAAFDRAAQ